MRLNGKAKSGLAPVEILSRLCGHDPLNRFVNKQVARNAQCKVESGDVVLTFAFSSAVLSTFLLAKKVRLRPPCTSIAS